MRNDFSNLKENNLANIDGYKRNISQFIQFKYQNEQDNG